MADTLEWVLKARDLIAPSADSGAEALVRLQVELKKTQDELSGLEKASHGLNIGRGLMGAAGVVGSIIGTVKDAVVGFAEMALSGAAFREDTTVAFTQILGSAEKANQLFDNALAVAKQTKFETRDVVNLYTELLSAGFKQQELNTLVAGLADVGTARGVEKAQQLERALAKTLSLGKLNADALQEITIAGVNRKKVEKHLAEALSLKGTDEQISKKVADALKKGAINSQTGIVAVLKSIKDQFDPGGQLGDFAKAQSNTLSGVWSNFKESFTNLFLSKETQELPAFKTLKQTMLMLSDFFDTTTPKGQAVLQVVNRLADDLLGVFELDPRNAEKTFNKLLGWLEGAERVVRRLTTWIKSELLPAMSAAFTEEGGLGRTLTNVLLAIGRTVGQGIWEGVKGAVGGAAEGAATAAGFAPPGALDEPVDPMVKAAAADARARQAAADVALPGGGAPMGMEAFKGLGKDAAAGIEGGLREGLDMHSPSRVMERIGREGIAAGLRNGVQQGATEVYAPISINGAAAPEEVGRAVRFELMRIMGGAARAPSPGRV